MEEEVGATQSPARWLSWATAVLLVVGIGAAGAVSGDGEQADQRIVTAAGSVSGGVEAPTTVVTTAPPTRAAAPTTTPAPATTTTTVVRATTTVPPTTQPPPQPPRTTTTVAAGTMLSIVNEHPMAVAVTVNGRAFQLAPGAQAGPVAIPRYDHGNDIVEVKLVQEASCGTGDADRYFPAPGSYRMSVVASPGLCQPGMPGPAVKVTRI